MRPFFETAVRLLRQRRLTAWAMRVSFFDSTWELVQLTMMIPSILSAAGKDWEQLAAGAAEVQEVVEGNKLVLKPFLSAYFVHVLSWE